MNAISTWVARIACLIAVLVGGLSDSRATGDLAEFNAAVEEVSAHNRVAIGYLRTENVDFAALEIDRMRNAWVTFTERFAGNRPDVFEGNPHYNNLFTVVNARLVGVDLMLKTGRFDAARNGLNAIRKEFYDLRKASGVVVLADCVRDSVRQMPEFRRLIDGTKASLELISKAIATRDADLLHRVLIELRSFDNLLDFRFG